MANTVKLKRSAVPAKVPLTTDLELGELAINTYDGKLYLKKNDGSDSIVLVNSTGGGGGGDLLAANNLSDLANAATARTNLGLGSISTYAMGTSGATVGLLNGNNTYSGANVFSGSGLNTTDFTSDLTFEGRKHRISINDGDGNFLLRIGHDYGDTTTSVWTSTETGFPGIIRFQQDTGTMYIGSYYTASVTAGATFTPNYNAALTISPSSFLYGVNTVWHSGNDGAGSGLDADLLDGYNIGTSGATIPLLSTANTWSTDQAFSGKATFGSATRQMIDLWSTTYGIGIQNGTQYYRTGGRFSWFSGGSHSVTENDPGAGGSRLMTLTSSGLVVGNVTPSSPSLIITRRSGDAIEWGHTTAAYHNTLGAEAGSGAGNLIFQGMNGTTSNTYKTTGVKASIMKSDNAGGFKFGTVASTNADNQTFVDRFSFDLTNAYLKGSTTESQSLYIGHGRSGSGNSAIYLIGDTTYSSWGATFYRDTGGANAHSWLRHRGTGGLYFDVNDAGSMHFRTNATTRISIDSGGTTTFTGNIVGMTSAATDVNTANDAGSISIRGSTTTVAAMSFHRAGAYAINMGLGTDNVFRIGGWSASNNALQLTGGGELTVLLDMNAVDFNASSDKRGKQKIKTAPSGKVSEMRGVLFERKKTKKPSAGVIAQEIEKVAPELVSEDDNGFKRVNYNGLIAYLIEDIKVLRKEIDELKKAA